MSDTRLMNGPLLLHAIFPPEALKATVVLALFSTWVLCGTFAYLNLHTRRSCFRLWMFAWLFYSMYLAASIGLGEWHDLPMLVMARQVSVGISALCLFWGSLQLTGRGLADRERSAGLAMILGWGCMAACQARERLWTTVPFFLLQALASAYTGTLYLRGHQQYRGAKLLVVGFFLWAVHQLGFPFQHFMLPGFVVAGYLVSAVLAQVIGWGMMMLMLEQARERNDSLLTDLKKGVAQRRLLEREVSVSEQKYRMLFDTANEAIFLADLSSFEIVEANEAAAHLVGSTEADLVGSSLLSLCPRLSRAGNSLLDNKRVVEDMLGSTGEFPVLRAQGGQVLCEGEANLVPYQKRPLLQINMREITERKKMEQRLRQSEKLSALGQLVAGVAHELNNPLAVVMGYAQILSRNERIEDRVRNGLLKILQESERAAKIVRNLLTFARPSEPHMVMVDVNRLVFDALEEWEPRLQSAHVQVVRGLTPDLPRTMADPNQLEEVLANLVANAAQALAAGSGSSVIEVSTEQRNGTLRIVIADNGPGIPPQILDRVFDPFFTTKGPGKGTGLGLSICYSIMEEHKGRIWVESEVGRGSRFFVELPVVAGPEPPGESTTQAKERVADPEAARRRLLIVDDEPGIVDVLVDVLGTSGYHIETASNGAEALARLATQRYDLIISDLCMPEMSGEKLYRRIGERFPHLQGRIIFVTGDTVSPASRQFLDETGAPWLSKPFNIREVERLVVATLRGEELVAGTPTGFQGR